MQKYTNDITIPSSIIRYLNIHKCELNLNDIERCEEDMYSESVIIPFSLLYDMDLACIKLIQESYNKIDFWNDNINKSDKEIIQLLLNRTDENPLSILYDNQNTINDLYRSLLKQEFGRILAIALNFPTGLLKLIKLMNRDSTTSITVYCDPQYSDISSELRDTMAEMEKKAMLKAFPNYGFSYITNKLRGCEAYRDYTVIFYKLSSELEKDLILQSSSDYAWASKAILCANYPFNRDEKVPFSLRLDLVLRTGITNNIGLTSVYADKDLQ